MKSDFKGFRQKQDVHSFFHSLILAFIFSAVSVGCSKPVRRTMGTPPQVNVKNLVIEPKADPVPGSLEEEILEYQSPSTLEEDEEGNEVVIQPTQKKASLGEGVPFEFNQKVADWISYFSQKDRERFQRFLDRGEPYREVIENIFEENRVPTDLYYLGLIESGFQPHAKSHASAVGVWQFIRSTGKLYGLDSDGFVDERRDPIRATEAAARYLRDLYRQFGSWYLALAAYNAGPGRIQGAIRRAGGVRDFWELMRRRKLPQETMDYVPKFLAAKYIGERPELFAFYINEEKRYPNVELVKVPSPVKLEKIEQRSGIPMGELSFVNPHFLRNMTHPLKREDEIWVPEKYVGLVARAYSSISLDREVGVKLATVKPPKRKSGVRSYTVRRGDTLRQIAQREGLSMLYLKRVNGLKSSKLVPGQKIFLSATKYRQIKSHPRKSRIKRRG